jgi:hypothetical protein
MDQYIYSARVGDHYWLMLDYLGLSMSCHTCDFCSSFTSAGMLIAEEENGVAGCFSFFLSFACNFVVL